MALSIREFMDKFEMDDSVANELKRLDGHIVLSSGEYDYRFNLLDPRHSKHEALIKKKNIGDGLKFYNKEWAFGHLIYHNGAVFFSETPTVNRDVEKHRIAKHIYDNLRTDEIFDNDRWAKRIDPSNVKFVVDQLLALCEKGLLP